MSWTSLALGHQPSDVVVIATGIAAVVASSVRPLFKWLEFRAFMRLWREIARRDSDMQWLEQFSYSMAAFRSRGKVVNARSPVKSDESGFPAQGETSSIQRDAPASLEDLLPHTVQTGNGQARIRVDSQGDNVLISNSKNPDEPPLTCSSVEWNMFVEGVQKRDSGGLLGLVFQP
jgi:uncharacterized protein DUF397